VTIREAGAHGVGVGWAGRDGVHVGSVGNPSTTYTQEFPNGFEVEGAEGYGLWVGRAEWDGVMVRDAGYDGLYVASAGDDGVHVTWAGDAGVVIGGAGNDGVHVNTVGSPSTTIPAYDRNGFEVQGAEGNGLYVGRADLDGVHVGSAGSYGVHVDSSDSHGVAVSSAGSAGVYVQSANWNGVHVAWAAGKAGYFGGDVEVTGSLSKGGGSFVIDHPIDPENKVLRHSFVESPDMMNVYNGNVTTDEEGYATVQLPDYFEALNSDYRYQLTVIGVFAQAIVAEEVADNRFVIRTDQPQVKVSWQVTGVRRDPWAEANRVVVEEDKPADEQGAYLHPQAYGLPETRGPVSREAGTWKAEHTREER
jgi:hypothetical protein